jgi:hypothetical protein
MRFFHFVLFFIPSEAEESIIRILNIRFSDKDFWSVINTQICIRYIPQNFAAPEKIDKLS